MQKAKHRTKIVSVPAHGQNGSGQNGNGFRKRPWMPGDPVEEHPLYSAMGAFKDNPIFEESVQLMKKLRQEELERDLRWLNEAEQEAK